jgi:hypothetical protein
VVTRPFLRVLVALAVSVTLSAPAFAQITPSAEYRLKAAFLFNFVQFVEWPSSAFADDRAPLVICVVGSDPFGDALDQTVARRAGDRESLDACHLLFVSRSEQTRLPTVLQSMGSAAPVLTVSDIDGFVGEGGTIGFFLDRKRIRFEISPSQAHRRGLKLSSQLLGLGRVREAGGGGGPP